MDEFRVSANNGTSMIDVHAQITADVEREEYEKLRKAAHAAGIEARRYLRSNSPKLTGDYRRGWATSTNASNGHVTVSVYNKTDWQLTHLLEDGHDSYNQYGGPYGHVRPANPEGHIQKAADAGEKVLESKLEVRQ